MTLANALVCRGVVALAVASVSGFIVIALRFPGKDTVPGTRERIGRVRFVHGFPDAGHAIRAAGPSAAAQSGIALDWIRLTPAAVMSFQAAASESFKSIARVASSIT